jgi:hypothetical protein
MKAGLENPAFRVSPALNWTGPFFYAFFLVQVYHIIFLIGQAIRTGRPNILGNVPGNTAAAILIKFNRHIKDHSIKYIINNMVNVRGHIDFKGK